MKTIGKWTMLSVLCTSALALAQPRPFVVFVRGFQPNNPEQAQPLVMQPVRNYLAGLDAEMWSVTWNCFRDGAAQAECPANDAQFLQDLGNKVNSLPLGRPVILIGHSFGGDALLKAVNGANGITPKINRPITALITIDPVGTGGLRLTANNFYNSVPNTVRVFFNRWQRQDAPPVNFLDNGSVPCSAGTCSQSEQRVQQRCDGSNITDTYQPPAPPCPNWVPRPLCPPAPPGITLDRVTSHGSLVDDAFVNRQIIEELHKVLSARREVSFFNRAKSRYVSAEQGGGPNTGPITVNRPWVGGWEVFDVIDLNGGNLVSGDLVNLATYNGFFASAQPDATVVADRNVPAQWETFTLYQGTGGTVTAGSIVYLVDAWGRYVSASPSSTLTTVDSFGCLTSGYGCAFVIDGKVTNNTTSAPVCQ